MATKKKKLFESIVQGASGTLAGQPKEWKAPPAKQVNRGTGSQTTNTGRSTAPNGVEILQAAQSALRGSSTPQPAPTVPQFPNVPAALKPDTGKVLSPSERVELVRQHEEQRKQKEQKAADTAFGNDEIGKDMKQELKERKEAEKVTFSDFLADPLYAISTKAAPVGRDIEGAARMLFNSKEFTERERRRANYNAALEAPQKANVGRALQGVLQQGFDEAGTSLVSTADFALGAPLRAVGWEDNPLHKLNEAAQASKAANQEYYSKNMENSSKAAKTAENLGVQAVAAVPDLVLAYLTAGGSTASGALARGGTRLAGREAALAGAEAVSKRAGATQLARQVAQSSAKNPMFWTSFARTTGNSYEQAKAQGASDWEASMYAIVNGILNSQVEAGSGVQALPAELQKGGSAVLAFLRSAVEEGNEEVVQGVIERSLQNLTYDADNKLVSATNDNAIFNPVTAAKEWGSGAAVGGILGLPGTIVQGSRNLRGDQQANTEAEAQAETSTPAAESAPTAQELKASLEQMLGRAVTMADIDRISDRALAEQIRPAVAAEQAAQNAAESPVTNATAQQGNLTAEPQTPATERETGQNGGLEQRARQSFTASRMETLRREGASDDAVNDLQWHNEMWDKASGSEKLAAYFTAIAESDPNFDYNDMLNSRSGQRIYSIVNDLVSHGGELSPEAAAQAASEIFKSRTGTVGDLILRAYELDGKQMPEGVRREYFPTDAEREEDKRRDAEYRKGIEKYKDARNRSRAKTGAEAQNFAPEDHIDNRTDDYIRKTSTKAFQHEHPELHEHFANIAQRIMEDAMVSVDRGVTKVSKKNGGGTRAEYSSGLLKVIERSGLSRNQVVRVCQDIINDQGSENYAAAKRVELALDELMSDTVGKYGDAEYKRKKGEITGGTQTGSFDEYLKENELVLALGMATEDELRAEWEALQAQNAVPEAQVEDVPTDANGRQSAAPTETGNASAVETDDAAALKATLEEMLGRPLTMDDLDSMTDQALADKIRPAMEQGAPTDAAGLPQGQGAMSTAFPYREAPTQTHGSDSLYNEDEREIEGLRPEDSTHKVNTDAEVDRNAQERLEFDYDGEKADLFETKQSWDDADTALAHRIMEAEIARARLTGDYSEVVRLQRVWEARGTEQGQALRQRGRFAHTAADIVGEAAETLLGDDGLRGDQDAAKEKLDEIAQFADEWESISPNDTENMKALIMRLNAARRTGGLFTAERTSRPLQAAIDAVAQQEGGAQFLRDIAEGQLRAMSADVVKLSPMNALKSIRYMAMLSKLNTTMRNLLGNTVFDITETVSNNIATPLDMFLSLRTGRRTTALDASWLSNAKQQGAKEAALRAYIETALDVDLGDTSNRFEQRTGRTHKMSSRNPVERFLSSMEKWQRYMLTVTDEFAKGGARAEQQRGIDRLTESGRLEEGALDEWAEETARQRTFQNDGRLSAALRGLRDAGNNALSIRDRQGGSFGLGDAILPFAQVPGNIAGQFFNYSPFGLVKGAAEVISVLKAGENATAQQQAQAVRDVGRGLNGTAIVALFTAMAANGILKVAGDDDKDKAALERDEGISGTQLNLDAALRWLHGEDTAWQDGDDLMSIGFLEPFNGDMAMGYLLAESYKDAAADGDVTAGERMSAITNANTEAALQAVMDLPAMSTLKNIGDAFEYSTAETTSGRVADAAVQFVGDTAASFVPNAVAGIAQGMDNGVSRVTRTSDKTGAAAAAENSLNSIKSKVPGLRSTLPQALDSWGQGRQTTATPLQNWFNANILPGAVTKYDTNKVNQELFRLMETQDVKAPARNPVKEVQAGDDKKKLTTEEQQTYQRHAGQTAFRELQNLMKTDQYRGMRDSERAAAFNAIMEFGKVNGAQWVGGSAETPSWASKSDGSTAQNAAFYSILQAAKQRMDEDSKGRTAAILGAVFNRKPDGKSTVQDDGTIGGTTFGVMQQFLDAKQIGKVQSAIANGYDPQSIAEFWDAMNSFSRAKGKTKAWALANGYTEAQFNELYGIFIK